MKNYSSTYSSDGTIPTSTYSYCEPGKYTFDLHGLSPYEAQSAIRHAAMEKREAIERGREQRKIREAHLRRQGFDEEYIKTH
jgi:hypothetical protein